MSVYKAEDTQVVFGTESDQNATVVPDHYVGGIDESAEVPDPEQEWLIKRYIGGTREPTTKHQGQRTYQGGSIPIILWDGQPLAWLLGSDTVTADTGLDSSGAEVSSTGDTLHTIEPNLDGKPPTKTMETAYFGRNGGSDFVRTFGGVTPNSGEITLDNESELSASLDLWGMSVSHDDTSSSVALPSKAPWMFSEITSNLSMFGVSFAELTEFSLEVENNLVEGRYIEDTDGIDPSAIHYGNLDYTFSPTIEVTDDQIYEELVNRPNSPFSANIQLENPNGYQIRFELSNLDLETAPHNFPEDAEPIEVEASALPESLTIKVTDPDTTTAYI